ncbi:pyridoxamine 5'-phosphate oxidase family protein [Dokdonella sp. MW10]|uniref:pyridoxamine 5'-phosphate oxidase family protein n=1 Tax=Dokdonella sp. MW10 TaxID=2992926 RepID=UPI003F7F9688
MPTPARHDVRRVRQRARYDAASIHAILDAAWLCHVAFADDDGQPFVIPMLYARDGDTLLLHGSIASRLMRTLGDGVRASIAVTLLDGLVFARSHFHHSANYRSVVAFGSAVPVTDADEKAAALARFVDAMIPGRAVESRAADRNELAATMLLRFTIEDASAKVREGGPRDDAADAGLPVWSGVVPMALVYGEPVVADDATPGVDLPASARRLAG